MKPTVFVDKCVPLSTASVFLKKALYWNLIVLCTNTETSVKHVLLIIFFLLLVDQTMTSSKFKGYH